MLDLQIGNMGGMAVCMNLRLDESGGRLPHIRVLMLLDRAADTFLARRAGAEGWLVKPLDSLRLRRAAATVLRGGTVYEGLPPAEVTEAECATGRPAALRRPSPMAKRTPAVHRRKTQTNRPVATRCPPGRVADALRGVAQLG